MIYWIQIDGEINWGSFKWEKRDLVGQLFDTKAYYRFSIIIKQHISYVH